MKFNDLQLAQLKRISKEFYPGKPNLSDSEIERVLNIWHVRQGIKRADREFKQPPANGAQTMQNVTTKIEGDKLFIEIDLTKEFGPSKSGKTIIIASTQGNQSVTADGLVKLGLNVYRYASPKGARAAE